ncbi:MAG: RNA-binding protein [Bacillota bacterium]|uniref:RNA-binding protein n=2 Tax=Virgibacillus TaxID=84406 RepID=A0A941IAF7_9BACI|nr:MULTISPECIES: YlmH/Sll1252 family protein [Virgibacillus]NAZ08032.1 RNA-binding protein [Agaribacter marinus]MBR7795317.1 RNA-binding protein [Virgibacillus salarius]MCC2249591.1 YlmH/Sll1252 family protein [Virgibacillus sp. AGTR]MDY7044171.1 YlmH/Sll1252 family protein [Virgibacillus sp. M23]QRZ16885.1 RNA-binding protein [Virgibacillus sp. AGTR]
MEIYQHFRKDEEPFIDQVMSWKEQVERSFQQRLTDFLDPREQQIMDMLIGSKGDEVKLAYHGGNPYVERKRVVIAPFYDTIQADDFQLTLLQASYQSKFVNVTHSDIMGAFLSLGIKRKKLGDIYVDNGLIQIVVADEIASYVKTNLLSIKTTKITLEEMPLSEFKRKQMNWEESDCTVSSLRLDTLVKEIYRISRKDAVSYINKSHVKVNFKVIEDVKFLLQEGDLLSLRGKGRSKVVQIRGKTKKDKIKVTTAILK